MWAPAIQEPAFPADIPRVAFPLGPITPIRGILLASSLAVTSATVAVNWPTRAQIEAISNCPPLNPEDYHHEIESVDTAIFSDQPLSEFDRDALRTRIGQLAVSVAADTSSLAQHFQRELRVLAWMAGSLQPGKSLRSSPLRRNWIRIRGSLFDDAEWFAWGEIPPDSIQAWDERGVRPEFRGDSSEVQYDSATVANADRARARVDSIQNVIENGHP